MRRILLVLTVALMMAAMMVVSAMPAFAVANPASEGGRGKGQSTAAKNCDVVVDRQLDPEEPPSPSKAHQDNDPTTPIAPTNCNHFFPVE
jgi:hypothetical protein